MARVSAMSEKTSSGPLQEAVARDPAGTGGPVALIGGDRLPESARLALRAAFPSGIIASSDAVEFMRDTPDPAPSLILLCAGSAGQKAVVEALSEVVPDIPVIVLADGDDEGLRVRRCRSAPRRASPCPQVWRPRLRRRASCWPAPRMSCNRGISASSSAERVVEPGRFPGHWRRRRRRVGGV